MLAMVVDDSKPVRGILSQMLRGLGFEVSEAINGQDALDQLEPIDGNATESKVGLVLLDLNMPILDGFAFLSKVRADGRFASLPILVLTAETNEATVQQAMDTGANAVLTKPVSKHALARVLGELRVFDRSGTVSRPSSPDASKRLVRPAPPSRFAPKPQVADSPTKPPHGQSRKIESLIRVMIVDDSVVVRGVVGRLIENDPELCVACSASDGQIAMNKLEEARPDVVLLDIEMPRMNGFETIKAIRARDARLPIIMFSSLTHRGTQATMDALLLGASDYVAKPGGAYMRDTDAGINAVEQSLIPKIKQFARQNTLSVSSRATPATRSHSSGTTDIVSPAVNSPCPKNSLSNADARFTAEVIAIGVSTGGPQALAELLPELARRCHVPILVVQHMPANFTGYLAERLRTGYGVDIVEAQHDQPIEPKNIYLAPGGMHMIATTRFGVQRIGLNQDPPVNACRPSVDVLFDSVSKAFGAAALGVVLTGMGSDGAAGCSSIKRSGGQVIIQDEATSVVWGMPGSVCRLGLADKIVPLSSLAHEISLHTPLRKAD